MQVHSVSSCDEISANTVTQKLTLKINNRPGDYCTFNWRYTAEASFNPYTMEGKAVAIYDLDAEMYTGCGIFKPVLGFVELSQYWRHIPALKDCSPPGSQGFSAGLKKKIML